MYLQKLSPKGISPSLSPTGQLCSQHPEGARRGTESTDSGGDHARQTQPSQCRTLSRGDSARRTHQRVCGMDGRWVGGA